MTVFRLSRSIYAGDLSGIGSRYTGGRWNSKGVPMVYTSSSAALCTAEVAVHLPLGTLPVDYSLVAIAVSEGVSVQTLDMKKLHDHWNIFPHDSMTQQIGDQFVRSGKNAILKVPSAVVQGDFNYLINPMHPDIKKVKIKSIEPYRWDERLFSR